MFYAVATMTEDGEEAEAEIVLPITWADIEKVLQFLQTHPGQSSFLCVPPNRVLH